MKDKSRVKTERFVVRFTKKDADLIREICDTTGAEFSEIIRRATVMEVKRIKRTIDRVEKEERHADKNKPGNRGRGKKEVLSCGPV